MLYDTSLFLHDDIHIGKKKKLPFHHQIGTVMEFSV